MNTANHITRGEENLLLLNVWYRNIPGLKRKNRKWKKRSGGVQVYRVKWTYPSSQVFGDQRHQQAGGGQQRASLRHHLHLHETHLAVVTGQSQRVHARAHTLRRQHSKHSPWCLSQNALNCPIHTLQTHTHLGVAPEEAIGDGDVDVEGQRLQDAGLRGDKLLLLVCIIANIKEVFNARWTALLQGTSEWNVKKCSGWSSILTDALHLELYTGRPYLKLGGYEHGGGADELQHLPVDWSLRQVVVCHLNGQVQGLVVQLKVLLDKHIKQNPVNRGNCRGSNTSTCFRICVLLNPLEV